MRRKRRQPEQSRDSARGEQPAQSVHRIGKGQFWHGKLRQHTQPFDHPMPSLVGDNRRHYDYAHTLGHNIAEQDVEEGNDQAQHQQLTQFDADIEG